MAYDSLSTSVPGLLAVSYVARKTLSTALNVLSTSANTASYFYTYFRPGTKDKDNLRFPPSTTQGNRAPILDFSIALKNDLETVLTLLDNMATGLDSTYKEDTTNTGRIDMKPDKTLTNFNANSNFRFQDIHPVTDQTITPEPSPDFKGPSLEDRLFLRLIPALEIDGNFDMGLTKQEYEYASFLLADNNTYRISEALKREIILSDPYRRALRKFTS